MQRNITDILAEWFYRLPNGYASQPYSKTELQILESVLKENNIESTSIIENLKGGTTDLPRTNISEGPGAQYDDAIKQRLNVSKIPAATGKYTMPGEPFTSQGSFELRGWTSEDKSIFEKLWPEIADSAIIGKGEIALYWLFNYQKIPTEARDARGGEAADLIIGGHPAEVKSYKSHKMVTGLGRWSDYKEERRIVQNIFGLHALTKAFKEGDTANPITEITFGKKHIIEAAMSLFAFLNLPSLETLTKEPPEGFGSDSIFSNMIANAKSVFPEMAASLSNSGVQNVKELTSASNPEDVAIQVLQMLAAKKYGNKPGNFGWIANVIPGKADVHFHQIDILKIDEKSTDALSVSGGTIKGNLDKIFG